eukprot:scaffold1195_cov358-Prasinococcus_capsulatus_cf.AAC.2
MGLPLASLRMIGLMKSEYKARATAAKKNAKYTYFICLSSSSLPNKLRWHRHKPSIGVSASQRVCRAGSYRPMIRRRLPPKSRVMEPVCSTMPKTAHLCAVSCSTGSHTTVGLVRSKQTLTLARALHRCRRMWLSIPR